MRLPRYPSPRWPEAQCDVTVIPGRQRGPWAPGPRATECAKGSQPVYTHALSDTLFLAPRGLCNRRETSKTLTLCSPLDPTRFRLQLTRARTQTLSKFPGRSGKYASLRAARAQGAACSPPPLRPRRRREASGAAREERIQKKSPEESGGERQKERKAEREITVWTKNEPLEPPCC